MALNKKRQVFVEEYLQCWNASEAARQAGYSHAGSQGHRLLKNAEIQALIAKKLEEKAMSADEVLVRLAKMGRDENLRALELIGKHHGLFADRSEVTVRGDGKQPIAVTVVDDWLQRLAQRPANGVAGSEQE